MPRLGRYVLPDQPLRVIQRGNNREAVFFGDEDYAQYRDWMSNHVHLLVTPHAADSLPRAVLTRYPKFSDEMRNLLEERYPGANKLTVA
jgi:REP element-mobilizing transposase RayT